MSLNRHAAARDANEPVIRDRFAHHGWHTEQFSEAGMPDLLCFPPHARVTGSVAFLVDVKMPGGKVTPAQVKKWTGLHALGIPNYVVRTTEDVDALVRGKLAAWGPEPITAKVREPGEGRKRAPRIAYAKTTGPLVNQLGVAKVPPRPAPPDPPVAVRTRLGSPVRRTVGEEVLREMMKPPGEENYEAALKRAMGAAKEAEETFAPPDAPDMTPVLGLGPHPERYDCPCAQCVAKYGARHE